MSEPKFTANYHQLIYIRMLPPLPPAKKEKDTASLPRTQNIFFKQSSLGPPRLIQRQLSEDFDDVKKPFHRWTNGGQPS